MFIRTKIQTHSGSEFHDANSCHLWKASDGGRCGVNGMDCRYGLTEVKVPRDCPLRHGPVLIKVTAGNLDMEER